MALKKTSGVVFQKSRFQHIPNVITANFKCSVSKETLVIEILFDVAENELSEVKHSCASGDVGELVTAS